jgi:hypothetical protein
VLPSDLLQQLLCLNGVSNSVMQEDNGDGIVMDTDDIEDVSDVQPKAKKAKKDQAKEPKAKKAKTPFIDPDADSIKASVIQARGEQMDYRADFAQLAPDVYCANT